MNVLPRELALRSGEFAAHFKKGSNAREQRDTIAQELLHGNGRESHLDALFLHGREFDRAAERVKLLASHFCVELEIVFEDVAERREVDPSIEFVAREVWRCEGELRTECFLVRRHHRSRCAELCVVECIGRGKCIERAFAVNDRASCEIGAQQRNAGRNFLTRGSLQSFFKSLQRDQFPVRLFCDLIECNHPLLGDSNHDLALRGRQLESQDCDDSNFSRDVLERTIKGWLEQGRCCRRL